MAVSPSSYVVPKAAGTKRKRSVTPGRSGERSGNTNNHGGEGCQFVLLAGVEYSTLPWYLGRQALKSQLQVAMACCSSHRVEMRGGDWNTMASHWGQEVLDQIAVRNFKNHRWVNTLCKKSKPERAGLQVKLLSDGREPSTTKFLWCLPELEKCQALKK